MKNFFLPVCILSLLTAGALAQKPARTLPPALAQQFIVKKQQLVDDFEMQLKEIPYVPVRVYIRYKLAEWLWKKGKDDTDRAETLAIKALDEAYTKKEEMSGHRFKLLTDIFSLIETNAKDTAARLKGKYDLNSDEDLFSGFTQINQKDGEQAVAQKLLTSLTKPGEINSLVNPLLNSLRLKKSAQFPLVVTALLEAIESGRVTAANAQLFMLEINFNDPQLAPALRARYFALVIERARAAVAKPDPFTYQMLNSAIKNFGEVAPDLMPEALGLKNALAVSETAANKAMREALERIEASPDKLAAMIQEAETAQIRDIKHSLYMRAEGLAKNMGKFATAVDLIDWLHDENNSEFMNGWTDQEYGDVARRAFERDETAIALTATERVSDLLNRAEAWKKAAEYFDGKKDPVAARDAIARMLKLLADGDRESGLRVHSLVRAIPVVQKIDRLALPEAIAIAAKAINDLPTPGVDDKPGTRKYNDYIFSHMWINYSLTTAMNMLAAQNKADAADLAERIQKREVRVVADLAVATDALDTAQKEAEKKAAAKTQKQ